MLILNIMPVIRARNIDNPYSFLVKSGFSRHSAHTLLYSKGRSFRLDHIEKLCFVLLCEPHDLLLWIPSEEDRISPDHPLHKLKEQISVTDWRKTLASMPLQQLKNISVH